MSLMNEIHRNQINAKQLIIVFDTIKRVIFSLHFVFQVSAAMESRAFNESIAYIHPAVHLSSHGPLKLVIQLFRFYFALFRAEEKVLLMTIDYLCL